MKNQMKTTYHTLLLALTFAATTASAATIVQWNFNSVPPDNPQNQGTGSSVPGIGTGTISVIGTTLQGTDTGAGYTSGDTSTDPATADDSAFHTRGYPPQGEGNKTSGIEVRASTVGYESIVVTWDQRNSGTASKYLRFQYSLDGSTFIDYEPVFRTDVTTFVNTKTVDLSPILAANRNPNFAFRLVAEFENTATGSGNAAYVTTGGGAYTTNGTMRFDMLTVSGVVADDNAFPTISAIPNQTIREDSVTDPLPFQIADAETPANELTVTGVSSNPGLVSEAGIILEGTGANRTVTISPILGQNGATTITLYVIDSGGKSNRTSFVVTVLPANTPPNLSPITNVHTIVNTTFAPISFTVSDDEQAADTLTLSASSSDQTVIPNENLVFGGTGGARTLTITPAADQVSNAVITVNVTDPLGLTASRTFNAMVVRSSSVIFSEPFNYADGSLATNSAGLWTLRAGVRPGEMQVVSGTVLVTQSQTEDLVARLIGGPYNTNSSTILYASFDVTFISLPTGAPDTFAHFSATNADVLLGRVLTTTNAPPGSFRLGVANGATPSTVANVVDYPLDLGLDTTYQVVVAYDVAVGSSMLWVNPASGGGWVHAIDPRGPAPINYYGLRQSGRIGDMRIDNLQVGHLTQVRIARSGNDIEVSWPFSAVWEGFFLESTRTLSPPDWQRVTIPSVPRDGWDVVTITNPTGNEFFRLRK